MMRVTAKALLTGIRGLLRSSIGGPLLMPPNRGKPSVAARIRADRTFLGEVAIVEALTAGAPSGVGAIARLEEEVSEAVKQGNKATAVARAVKARRQEGAVVPEVAAAVVVPEVAVVVAEEGAQVVAAAGAGRNRQTAQTIRLLLL
jgi:hypothetical protein